MTFFGVILIILGILAMLAPGFTGISVSVFVGILMVCGGVAQFIWAFSAGSLGRGVLSFLVGVLTVLAGIALLANPLMATGFLTIMLAVYLIVDGIAEIALGAQVRPAPGSGWLIFGGILSILLGIMIWAQYPLSGGYAIGTLLGIKLFMVGMIMVTGGTAVKEALDRE